MSESTSTPAPKSRKGAAKAAGSDPDVTIDTAEVAADSAEATAAAVETATADAKSAVTDATADVDATVASAADSAAETVADAANEAAAEAAASTEADSAAAETAAVQAHDAAAPVRTVYVTAPTPPAKKGNRVLGILIALLAAGVFAVVYAAAIAVIRLVQGGSPAADLPAFLASASFIFPIAIVFIVFTLWALLVNRAGWWSWVIGSLIIAVAVYAGTIGLAQLFYQVQIPWTDPILIVSAVLAREVTMWLGGILSTRGRRLKVRNTESRAQFDKEEAERRAERERHA